MGDQDFKHQLLDVTEAVRSVMLARSTQTNEPTRCAVLLPILAPRLVEGSLTGDSLSALCRVAPADATLVVFHTAVLADVADQADKQAFADRVATLCPYWICNEAPRVMPYLAERAGEPRHEGRFLMSINSKPVAWTDPHGAAIDWIADIESHQ